MEMSAGASIPIRTTPDLIATTWIVTSRLGRTIFSPRCRERTSMSGLLSEEYGNTLDVERFLQGKGFIFALAYAT
jgi:hypothetical protein